MKYGLQMYSVRDVTRNDMEFALKKVAEMGYSYIEFAGFFGHSSSEINAMLKKYGLICTGTHSSWEGIKEENIDYQIAYHKEIGCKNYIIPGLDLSSKEKLDSFIELVNKMQPVLEKEGITLSYHNHYAEFMPNNDGLYIHNELQNRTHINFEIDTYWAFYAGVNPLELLEKLKDRITCIHLKDGIGLSGKALGEGNAPVDAVRKKASELGFTVIVESEGLDPNGLSEVKRCIDYLKKCE